jgi:ATP-dependent protease ClpP protease subunit
MKRAFLAVLLASTAVPAYAANIVVRPLEKGDLISIDGQIGPNDFDVFKAKASPVSGRSVVFLNSPGGNLVAALQIGEFIRLKGWATIVPSECYSSCALIWLAGTERMMPANAKIGFHAASMDNKEIGVGNALIGTYLNRLGLSYGAVAFVTQASPDEITYLTPAEAKRVGIDVRVIEDQPAGPKTATYCTSTCINPCKGQCTYFHSTARQRQVSHLTPSP